MRLPLTDAEVEQLRQLLTPIVAPVSKAGGRFVLDAAQRATLARVLRKLDAPQSERAPIDYLPDIPALYELARDVSHLHGFSWTDPRTGVTHEPPRLRRRRRRSREAR